MPHWLQESGLLEDMFAILGCQPFKAGFFFVSVLVFFCFCTALILRCFVSPQNDVIEFNCQYVQADRS